MSSSTHPGYRVFILGAGFSKPAGLPLANELYPLVRKHIVSRYGMETKFERDVQIFIDYCQSVGIPNQSAENLDLEKFMSFLDIEHHLGLRGSDTFSSEGNESQLMIRNAIGSVIHTATPKADELPNAYIQFAKSLAPTDIVLTLNYDLVLENALRAVDIPFRRYPYRFKSSGEPQPVVDRATEEVVVLKLHGSIDWFDDRQYQSQVSYFSQKGADHRILGHVFDRPAKYGIQPLVNGPLPSGDQLVHLLEMTNLDAYYSEKPGVVSAPYILTPSHVKFVYAEPVLSFYHGLSRSGGHILGCSVIGFSLPDHDDYIRIWLYQMLSNYMSWWDEKRLSEVVKDYARFVDYRTTTEGQRQYRDRYSFVDPERSQFYFDGFEEGAIDFLFNQGRQP